MSGRGTDLCVFPRDCGDPNDLTNITTVALASNPILGSGPRHGGHLKNRT